MIAEALLDETGQVLACLAAAIIIPIGLVVWLAIGLAGTARALWETAVQTW